MDRIERRTVARFPPRGRHAAFPPARPRGLGPHFSFWREACRHPDLLMPGLCGFVVRGQERPVGSLQTLLESLRHHPGHYSLPPFSDGSVAAGLVLRQADLAGFHREIPGGIQVWVDGEAFGDNGPMTEEELAAEL